MIRINHLRLRSVTATRIFGADIALNSGLNVLQAHNTSGKSTCLQSIIYVLGLERTLGPQLNIPLPYAMRERIHQNELEPYELVLKSYVEMEIENNRGDVFGLHRDVVGGSDTKLIQTWRGRILSGGTPRNAQRDFYVHDGGAAQREDGFHRFLASFLGLDLPTVPRFDGTDGLLYLEAIFPMLFVEQKRGWSTIEGPFPTFFKIQDVARRVMEFLLDLDVGKSRRERSEIRAGISGAVQKWMLQRRLIEEQSAKVGRIRGIPNQPNAEFALAPEVNLELYDDGHWLPIATVKKAALDRINSLESLPDQTAEDAAPEVIERLTFVRNKIDELTAFSEVVRDEYSAERQENIAIESRLASLRADLKRNQDAHKLQKLGSQLGRAASDHICPTCHQDVASELLPAIEGVGMGLEENISFVRSQIRLYEASLAGSTQALVDCSGRYQGIEREIQTRQQELRNLRQALSRPSAATSRIAIEDIVRLQSYIDRIQLVDEAAASIVDDLAAIAREWSLLTDKLKSLPTDEFSPRDKRKIETFELSVRRKLMEYGFRSFVPGEICLSRENFRPLVNSIDDAGDVAEKEINFEISASDAIRLKWAFYIALMEISFAEKCNHPGLLVFDEPGQQEIEDSSLYAFLSGASDTIKNKQQIIVSTSEPLSRVKSRLSEAANIVAFDGFILQPIASKS